MMTLTLQITNFQELPTGGPLSYMSQGRNFDIGRDMFLDWVLPDAKRSISGRHAEVRFDGENYYLTDISTNGTFVNGAGLRVKSPYRIFHGDKFVIGHYVIVAHVQSEAGQPDIGAPRNSLDGDSDDIWGASASSAPPPMNRRDFQPPQNVAYSQPDFASSFIDMPAMSPRSGFPPVEHPGLPPTPQQPMPQQGGPQQRASRAQPGFAPAAPASGQQHPGNPFAAEGGFNRPTPGAANWSPAAEPAPSFQQDPRPAVQAGRSGGVFMDAFVRAAKLSPATVQSRNQAELGEELGEMMLISVELMMMLLSARASAKLIIRSSDRTMIGPLDNNPLKFVPGAAAALDTMLSQSVGYLDGRRAFREAFDDLKAHESATYAAMQAAVFRLIEDELAPDAIEKKVAKSTFSNAKAKAWETYVSLWNSKIEGRENRMLDVFLAYFNESYRETTGKKR